MSTYKKRITAFYRIERAKNLPASQALRCAKYEAKYGERSHKRDILPSHYSAYEGEEVTTLPNGWKIKVAFKCDQDSGPPWDCDGYGVVTDWQRYDEHLDNWELCSDRRSYRYYDWRTTLPIAIKDGWDAPPYRTGTPHERAMRAMKANYEYLRRWCNDDWFYVGLIVTLLDENDEELAEESCWGFESDAMSHMADEARSWAAHMIREERRERREAALQARIDARFHDAMENAL